MAVWIVPGRLHDYLLASGPLRLAAAEDIIQRTESREPRTTTVCPGLLFPSMVAALVDVLGADWQALNVSLVTAVGNFAARQSPAQDQTQKAAQRGEWGSALALHLWPAWPTAALLAPLADVNRPSSSLGSRGVGPGKRNGVEEEAPGASIMGDFAVGSMQTAR